MRRKQRDTAGGNDRLILFIHEEQYWAASQPVCAAGTGLWNNDYVSPEPHNKMRKQRALCKHG